jgi:TolA-binding protein
MWPVVVMGAVLLGPALTPGALAQVDSREAIALQNQIYQLRQEVQMLRDQGGRGGAAAPAQRGGAYGFSSGSNDMVAQLLTRVDAMEEQIRQLRGRIDENQNQMQRQNADLSKKIDDLAFQMSSSPAPGAAAPARPVAPPLAAPTPAPVPLQPPAATGPTPRTPERALQEGNAALARRDYTAAEQSAREVLSNRTSPRAYDAQFLLAQSLAGQRQFPQAAIAYDDTYNRSRKGSYAQDALLGLANSLTAINEKKAACDTLGRLAAEFPQVRNDLREPIAGARQRASCR